MKPTLLIPIIGMTFVENVGQAGGTETELDPYGVPFCLIRVDWL